MAQIFRFLLAGGGSGEKALRSQEDWLSHGVPSYGGAKGRGSAGLLSLCFLVIRGLPSHHRAIWKINVQHDDGGCHPHSGTARSKSWQYVRVETSGCTSEAREIE